MTSLYGIYILTLHVLAFQSRVMVPPSIIVVDWFVPNVVQAYTSHAYYFCIFLFVVHFLTLYLGLLLLAFLIFFMDFLKLFQPSAGILNHL